jgi:succinyl-diaminopimelate desuccinylase
MKGAIAAFVAAVARRLRAGPPAGSISLLITGDEEGPAINGTRKALDWLAARGERIDHCLVGEPTSSATLGDMMKVGRRGSMNSVLLVRGAQGHVAYPDRARNPVHALNQMLSALIDAPLDAGYERFPPSSLQVTDLEVGNLAHNVIPATARARFNVRFNPNWTGARLEAEIRRRLDAAAAVAGVEYVLNAVVSGEAFLSDDNAFIGLVAECIRRRTGLDPELSTSGGTSDARFIRNVAPVAEFGLVGRTIHQVDERAPAADIATLAAIYEDVLAAYFERRLTR